MLLQCCRLEDDESGGRGGKEKAIAQRGSPRKKTKKKDCFKIMDYLREETQVEKVREFVQGHRIQEDQKKSEKI